MGDSDRGVHSERAVERISSRDVGNLRLGDVRVVEEDAQGTGEQIVIARVLDGALEGMVCVKSSIELTGGCPPGGTRSRTCADW